MSPRAKARLHYLSKNKGVALMTVLVIVALMMVLVLGILNLGTSEKRSSSAFSESVHVRTLADLPANLIIGQIKQATTGLGSIKTWASQPGMIRVYNSAEQGMEAGYKLYSSDTMVVQGPLDVNSESAAASDWHNNPAGFTNLNEPAWTKENGTVRQVYPILDPAADGTAASGGGTAAPIEGYQVTGAPGNNATSPVMPVKWLYVLKDGRIVAPTSITGRTAKFSADVTASNPIVGRIAFWTDDESCKVNVNTASEGTPWDVPRSCSWTDRNFGERVPSKGEYQRYPGHPAMTSLSPVLKAFDPAYTPLNPIVTQAGDLLNTTVYTDFLKRIYSLSPRVNYGIPDPTQAETSQGGSVIVDKYKPNGTPLKRERLYATTDEFFYSPARAANLGFEPRDLEVGRFFLTAYSRAPETNLFNRPRVSLWPQLKPDLQKRSTLDKMIAFCSTTWKSNKQSVPEGQTAPADQEASFWRKSLWEGYSQATSNPNSALHPTEDFNLPQNQTLFRYLQNMTTLPIPGVAAKFSDKYSDKNRNQQLLGMFDLLRWGVNSWSSVTSVSGQIDQTKSYFYLPPRAFSGLNQYFFGEAMAVPTKISSLPIGSIEKDPTTGDQSLKGFGRVPTISEVCVVFMATTSNGADTVNNSNGRTAAQDPTAAPDGWYDQVTGMQAFIILQPFTPVVGIPPYTPHVRYAIEGLDTWQVEFNTGGTAALGFPASTYHLCNNTGGGGSNEQAHGTAFTSITQQFSAKNNSGGVTAKIPDRAQNELNRFPFYSAAITVPTNAKTFKLKPGSSPIKIKIYSGFGNAPTSSSVKPIQEIQVQFPQAGTAQSVFWQVPRKKVFTGGHVDMGSLASRLQASYQMGVGGYPAASTATAPIATPSRCYIIQPGDTVRSMIFNGRLSYTNPQSTPSGGDYRLLSALSVVPPNFFNPHPHYSTELALLNDGNAGNPLNEQDDREITRTTDFDKKATAYRWSNEAQSLRQPSWNWEPNYGWQYGEAIGNSTAMVGQSTIHISGHLLGNESSNPSKNVWFFRDCYPVVPKQLKGAYKFPTGEEAGKETYLPGDWDNGPGRIEDGPYINKPDEAGVSMSSGGYFTRSGFSQETGASFSPNRQICSAVAFGSLPSVIFPDDKVFPQVSHQTPVPWQTLLFCPNPPSRRTAPDLEPVELDHYGFKSPRDHYLLDLFWMPVVEPFAISEPFSTAGKININYQILPFTHIKRSSAIHSLMRSVRVNALPTKLANAGDLTPHTNNATNGNAGGPHPIQSTQRSACYKIHGGGSQDWSIYETLYEVNVNETLKGFERKFSNGDIFRSPSEICDLFLVPKFLTGKENGQGYHPYAVSTKKPPSTIQEMVSWWNGKVDSKEALKTADDGYELTGDNTRESPYNQLYPRLTTRSNVYQVHYRVQVLKKAKSTSPSEWNEDVDRIAADYRGSSIVERFVDPNDPNLPNFIQQPERPDAVDDYCQYRIVRSKQFVP